MADRNNPQQKGKIQKNRKGDTSRTSNQGRKLSSGGRSETDNQGRPDSDNPDSKERTGSQGRRI